jgi:cytochrome b561
MSARPMHRWDGIAVFLHWATAALVLFMLGLGLAMVHGDMGLGTKFAAYQWHKATGVLVLIATLVRGLWRLAGKLPDPAGNHPRKWQHASYVLHLGLYLLLVAISISGWLVVSWAPLRVSITFLGGLSVPYLAGPNEFMELRAIAVHKFMSRLLMVAIALHVAAVLKHHFMDHDPVLWRMLPLAGRSRDPTD